MNHYLCPYNGAQFYGEYKWGKFLKEGAHWYLNRALTLILVPLVVPTFLIEKKKPMPMSLLLAGPLLFFFFVGDMFYSVPPAKKTTLSIKREPYVYNDASLTH